MTDISNTVVSVLERSDKTLSLLEGFGKAISKRFPDDAQDAPQLLFLTRDMVAESGGKTYVFFDLYTEHLQEALSKGDADSVVRTARKIAAAQKRFYDFMRSTQSVTVDEQFYGSNNCEQKYWPAQ